MKKLLAIAVCIVLFTTAKSQIYVQGGVNLSNITTTNTGGTQNNNLLTTFNAGIMARSNKTEPIALEAGLLIEGKGAKANSYLTSSTNDNYVKASFNPLYLELPVNFVLRLPLTHRNNIFINAGPYVAMGIGGKTKIETSFLGDKSSSTSTIQFNNDDPTTSQQEEASYDKLKRFDYGINVGAGIDLRKILLKVNYGYGLSKINSTQTDNSSNDKNKYRIVSISLGIPLGL
ncbi:MAG TPA: porin family protein [Hanamia sp.]|nr:porin family protein [Hanamia sp.]